MCMFFLTFIFVVHCLVVVWLLFLASVFYAYDNFISMFHGESSHKLLT